MIANAPLVRSSTDGFQQRQPELAFPRSKLPPHRQDGLDILRGVLEEVDRPAAERRGQLVERGDSHLGHARFVLRNQALRGVYRLGELFLAHLAAQAPFAQQGRKNCLPAIDPLTGALTHKSD